MAGRRKVLTILLVLCLARFGRSQTSASIGQNFCLNNLGIADSLSCPEFDIEGVNCFTRDNLCNGSPLCDAQEDEGSDSSFSSLQCESSPGVFSCGPGLTLPLADLCDGVADCGLIGGLRPADDELAVICDNKCLLPFYGQCDLSRVCINSRNGVNCGACLPGFVEATPIAAACLVQISISLNAASITFNEDAGQVQLCAMVSSIGTITTTIPSSVTFTPGTATGADYTQLTQSLSFTDAIREDCIEFIINDDLITESTESFTIGISVPAGNQFSGGITSASVNIIDNDLPIFAFSSDAFTGSEAAQSVSGTVNIINNISPTSPITITVNAAPSGSALASDFTTGQQTVTFQAGELTSPFSVVVADDAIIEDTESFQLQLFGASSGSIDGAGTAIANIIDNDVPTFGFNPLTYTVTESNSQQGLIVVESGGLAFGGGVSRDLTVNCFGSGTNSATSGVDFQAVANQLFTVSGSPMTFSYTLIDDSLDELVETFQCSLSVPAGSNANVDAAASTATVSISDNDLTSFSFSQQTYQVDENEQTVEVCVQLTGGTPSSVVTITLDPGAQSAGTADFNDVTMTVFFPANSAVNSEECVNFVIVNDIIIEPTEAFEVVASSAIGFFADDTAQVLINDDDNAIFQFTQAVYMSSEGTNPAIVTVQLAPASATLGSAATVQVSTQNTGSATAGVDFTPQVCTLVFPAGSSAGSSMNCEITVIDDSIVENTESIPVLGNIQGQGQFTDGTSQATSQVDIIDNDVLEVAYQFSAYTMPESSDQVVCLTVTGGSLAPGLTASVNLATSPGNAICPVAAIPPADYDATPNPSTITFIFGDLMECVTLDIVDDDADEPDEAFTLTATPVGSVSIASPSVGIKITDNDLLIARFAETEYNVDENGNVEVCVDLTFGIVGAGGLTINVANVLDTGSATLSSDYNTISQPLFFPEGSTPGGNDQACFFIAPIDDSELEFSENFMLVASSDNVDLEFTQDGGNMAVVNIIDDDTVTVTIVPPTVVNVNEGEGPVEVCVALVNQAPLGRPVSVVLSTADITAVGAAPGIQADYCSEEITVTFQPGAESEPLCVDVLINDDTLCEGAETFSVNAASGPDGGSLIISPTSTVTIIDNDVALISSESEYSIPENIGVFEIPVVLLGQKAAGRSCVVTATTMDGTALSVGLSPDYVGDVSTLTFDSETILDNIPVELIDDGICEGIETFQIFLATSSDGCEIADGSSPITITIEDDEIGGGGDDPHFSIVLPTGRLLCYTVQGEHGFSFNLISNKRMTMNAKFVPDSRRSEVTWMGSMGIIVKDNTYKQANATALRFEAIEKKIYIGDKVELMAKNIEKMTFKDGKLMISEAPPTDAFKYPSIYVDLQDVEITFTMKFLSEHLDIFWHRTGGKIPDSHGIIGQFFRTGVEIDEVRKILIMPNKEPVPVMRRPVWSFMEREKQDDQLCWTAMNPGYQGEGLIDGTYFDYLVDNVMTTEFQFKK